MPSNRSSNRYELLFKDTPEGIRYFVYYEAVYGRSAVCYVSIGGETSSATKYNNEPWFKKVEQFFKIYVRLNPSEDLRVLYLLPPGELVITPSPIGIDYPPTKGR